LSSGTQGVLASQQTQINLPLAHQTFESSSNANQFQAQDAAYLQNATNDTWQPQGAFGSHQQLLQPQPPAAGSLLQNPLQVLMQQLQNRNNPLEVQQQIQQLQLTLLAQLASSSSQQQQPAPQQNNTIGQRSYLDFFISAAMREHPHRFPGRPKRLVTRAVLVLEQVLKMTGWKAAKLHEGPMPRLKVMLLKAFHSILQVKKQDVGQIVTTVINTWNDFPAGGQFN
jgi:hypothetical protein